MKLTKLKPNPNNPRIIRDEKFAKLKQSIQDFPKMLSLRPIVVDNEFIVLGGNMRLRALQDLGYKEIPDEWVKKTDELTEDEKQRFIIEDNVPFGEWNWEQLANEWENEQLNEWGLEIPNVDAVDLDDFFEDGIKEQKNQEGKIVLNYSPEEATQVREGLLRVGKSLEDGVWKLLKL